MNKTLHFDQDDKRWTFYDAQIEDAIFEWPDPFGDDDEKAKEDCIKYLDQIFIGKYRMTSFQKREVKK